MVQLPFVEPKVKPFPIIEAGSIPYIHDFGLPKTEPDARSVINYSGGEQAALRQMQEYIWNKDLLKSYKETRNGLIGCDYSSKFSPALSLGCISARTIHFEVKKYEQERLANDSTYWLVFELLWRDYFRFVAAKNMIRGTDMLIYGVIKNVSAKRHSFKILINQ